MIVTKLVIKHKNYEIINCEFNNTNIDSSSIYKTLIIGQNASGKSFMLRQICDVFEMIEQYVNTEKIRRTSKRYDHYEISYLLDQDEYMVIIDKQSKVIIVKNKEMVSITELLLPKKVIATTYLFDDKFKFSRNDNSEESIYYYGGTKTTSNAIFTSNSQLDLLRYITKFINTSKQSVLTEILQYLGYSSNLKILIRFKNVNLDRLVERRMSKNLVSNRIKKIDELNKIEEVRELYEIKDLVNISLNLSNAITDQMFEKIKKIQILEEIGAIKSIDILLKKESIEVPYEYCSSGEKQLLFTFMKIGTAIEENSIVLIDEPESSLHPSWQIRYIKDLEEIFLRLNFKVHFIISSHSAYMISSMEKETSSLVTVKSNNKNNRLEREFELVQYSTYAWSMENILYEVFNMRTTRNFYFLKDMENLIDLVENSTTDFKKLDEKIKKLKQYSLSNADPLNNIIEIAEEYYNENKENK
ncbi:AAA family ATPase [Vagococcus fluvialis]|uniref:AAA family ATPase n=1 Tax=Vagococcus fluvialis TaxID=2738 RepID=UPI003D0E60AE